MREMQATVVGFTGTQRGMTADQAVTVRRLLMKLEPEAFHHGDCIGADEQAHELAMRQRIPVVIHPPKIKSKRAFCEGGIRWKPKPYLARNRDIVDCSSTIIATPGAYREEIRSGTWSTIRYAKRMGKELYIVYPNGEVDDSIEGGGESFHGSGR